MYAYGLKARPLMPGAVPRGFSDWQEFDGRCLLPCGERVWAIVWYKDKLDNTEVFDYELARLEAEDK